MLSPNRRFSLALQALTELNPELPALEPAPILVVPTLDRVLSEIGPLPREALFLGLASDGLPVLLNLRDPVPGPILITGDAGAGKTAFLQAIAHSSLRTHTPDNVQFGVITRHPEEWKHMESSPHLAGLFLPQHNGAQEMILALTSWAHSKGNSHRSVLLMIDDLEAVTQMDFDTIQNFRWLLLRGSSRGAWLFVTLNAGRYAGILPWLALFRTRLFGRIADERVATAVGADRASGVDRLEGRPQFTLRENGNWVQFWLPGV